LFHLAQLGYLGTFLKYRTPRFTSARARQR
jgi:hypothetical protein